MYTVASKIDVVTEVVHDTITFALRDTILVPYPDTVWTVADYPDTVWAVPPPTGAPPEWIFGIAGVIIGFSLSEVAALVRRRRRRAQLRAALRHECEALLTQIPDFIDICNQMIESLRNHRFLPGPAVRALRTVYDASITELTPHLTSRQRNLLHVVHERLRVGDSMIAEYDRDLLETLRHGQIADPWGAWIGRFEEQIGSYRLVIRLLRSFVDGNPVDVFHLQDPGDAGGTAARAAAPPPVLPPTHDVARHFLRIVGRARQAAHGIDAKIGNTGGFGVVGPRGLRPDLTELQRAIEEFKASEARVVELRQPALEKKLSDAVESLARLHRRAVRDVTLYDRPDVTWGPGVPAHFRILADSARADVARLDVVKAELEKLTT